MKEISELEEMLLLILKEEQVLEDEDGKKLVRLDKMGKIGEYLFCCLLADFLNLIVFFLKFIYRLIQI